MNHMNQQKKYVSRCEPIIALIDSFLTKGDLLQTAFFPGLGYFLA
jgi:hypothetical protein